MKSLMTSDLSTLVFQALVGLFIIIYLTPLGGTDEKNIFTLFST